MLTVFKPGEEIECAGIVVTVLEVLITGEDVKYKCSWWSGSDRKNEWFSEFELSGKASQQTAVGFHTLLEK